MARGDVFTIYTQPDRDVAYELVSQLEAHGIGCWIAPRDVQPEPPHWVEQIVNAVTGCKVMVLVFSASSNNSPSVRREVELAMDHRIQVVPFRIADVAPSASFQYCLSRHYWVDAFPPPLEPHYARLCTYLNTILAAGKPTRMWAWYLPTSRRQR